MRIITVIRISVTHKNLIIYFADKQEYLMGDTDNYNRICKSMQTVTYPYKIEKIYVNARNYLNV